MINNYCCECGAPIYANVNKDCEVVCGRCTMAKVARIAQLERETGIEITNTERLQQALTIKKYETHGYSGKTLKEARENRGWTQDSMAFALGVSKSYLRKMENGSKPLNTKALDLIANGGCE